jgi:hypothetical protein
VVTRQTDHFHKTTDHFFRITDHFPYKLTTENSCLQVLAESFHIDKKREITTMVSWSANFATSSRENEGNRLAIREKTTALGDVSSEAVQLTIHSLTR